MRHLPHLSSVLIIILNLFFFQGKIVGQSSSERYSQLAQEVIYFDIGKSNIRSEDLPVLDRVCGLLETNETSFVNINAHTDATGTDSSNEALSQQRADAVKAYFLKKGIPIPQITMNGYGETMPVATNNTQQGRQQNRRATITVIQRITMPYVPESQATHHSKTTLNGKVVDKKTNVPIREANVIVQGQSFKVSLMTNESGHFKTEIPLDTLIDLNVYAKGYFYETKKIKRTSEPLDSLVVKLFQAEIGAVVEIKNLYFERGLATLMKKSEPELPKVLQFMRLNKDFKVEIGGHVNYPIYRKKSLNKTMWNMRLSQSRAQMVTDYLIANGIEKEKIKVKGYSNYQMIFPKPGTYEEMERNRRVEIKVLYKDEEPELEHYIPEKHAEQSHGKYDKYLKLLKTAYQAGDKIEAALHLANLKADKDRTFEMLNAGVNENPYGCERIYDWYWLFDRHNFGINLVKLDTLFFKETVNLCESVYKEDTYESFALKQDLEEQAAADSKKKEDTTKFNMTLVQELKKIYDDDQEIRKRYTAKNITPELKIELGKEMYRIDSINLIKIDKIFKEHGYPSKEIVGKEGNFTPALVIHHSKDLETRYKYLPLLKKAVKDGVLGEGTLNMINIRIEHMELDKK